MTRRKPNAVELAKKLLETLGANPEPANETAAEVRPPAQYVYFMQCNAPDGPIKIGWSANVERRLSSVRMDCPYPIVMIASIPTDNGARDEARLHRHFSPAHIRGEWFEATHELLEFATRARHVVLRETIAWLSEDDA